MGVTHKIESTYRCDAAGCTEYVLTDSRSELSLEGRFACCEIRRGSRIVERAVLCPKHDDELGRILAGRFGFAE